MSVAGIVVEYNPLHNGHIYHIIQTRLMTKCDYIVAVMSGNFVQRGEPALLNKWSRTKTALFAGVDLVIELPVIYSTSSAEGFAFGAISLLNSLGIVDSICFGSEIGEIEKIKTIADILSEEPFEYRKLLQKHLRSGLSYPSARQNSLINYIIDKNAFNANSKEIEEIIANPNNILAVEYLKALNKLNSNIKSYTIKRIGSGYNENMMAGSISSATAIRNNIECKEIIKQAIPEYTYEIILDNIHNGTAPVTLENFSDLILYRLRQSSTHEIENLVDVSEGLRHKIKRAAEDSRDVNELIDRIKNKRYTSTRIKRILIYSLLGITKNRALIKIKSPAEYVRVLGFNNKGRELLKQIKNNCHLPIITNPSSKELKLIEFDVKATDIYVFGYKNSFYKTAKQDLKTPPVIVNTKY